MNDKLTLAIETAKATPPTALAGLIILGYTLQDWVLLGSLVLIALQIFFLIKEKLFNKKDK